MRGKWVGGLSSFECVCVCGWFVDPCFHASVFVCVCVCGAQAAPYDVPRAGGEGEGEEEGEEAGGRGDHAAGHLGQIHLSC